MESTLLWALGILVTVNIVVVGAVAKGLWNHVIACNQMREEHGALKARVEDLQKELGHDTHKG